MPSHYKVQTCLDREAGAAFSRRAREFGISDYELAKEMILYCLNDDVAKGGLTFRQKVKRFLETLDKLP